MQPKMVKILQLVGESFGLEKNPTFQLSKESEEDLNEAIRKESMAYQQRRESKSVAGNQNPIHRLSIQVTPASDAVTSIESSTCPDRRQSHCGATNHAVNEEHDHQRKASL